MAIKPKATDPLDVNARLYKQIALLLDEMESHELDITFPQRISALIAIGRVQKIFVDLRKGDLNVGAGSEVRKYAVAFAPDAARGRKAGGTVISFDSGGDSSDAEPGDPDYDA